MNRPPAITLCIVAIAASLSIAQTTTTKPVASRTNHGKARTANSARTTNLAGSSRSRSKSALRRTSISHTSSKHSSSRYFTRKGRRRYSTVSWRTRGQQKIDSQRTQDIQQALIRRNYLTGEPSGVWDMATQKAMERYQADNGWQNKTIPDARALIKLGLGPGQEHLLNPETAMTSQFQPLRATGSASSPATPPLPASLTDPAAPGTISPDPKSEPIEPRGSGFKDGELKSGGPDSSAVRPVPATTSPNNQTPDQQDPPD